MLRVWGILATLLLSFGVQAHSQDSVKDWLNRMKQAASTLNYQGVVVLGNLQSLDSYQIWHANINGKEYEFIEQLSGHQQHMVRTPESIFCAHHDDLERHLPLKNPLRPQASFLFSEDFPYQFTLGEQQRMAGRLSQQILLQPSENGRYSAALWLDYDTGMLLRSELRDANEVLVRAQFVQFMLNNDLVASDFATPLPGHHIEIKSEQPNLEIEQPNWLPSWLPQGFTLQFVQQHANAASRLMYFDGLVSFSLFVDVAERQVAPIERRWNATGAVVLEVQQGEQHRRVTAVGELPLETLKRIAASVQYSEEHQPEL